MPGQSVAEVANTLGALLIGSLAAAAFTGITTVQLFIYFKLYPSDMIGLKVLALIIWFLDLAHTILIGRTVWHGLIMHFGVMSKANTLPWTLAFTIVDTTILTIIVHCFFVYRIHILTNQNYFISVPLAILASSRLAFACVAAAQMITLRLLSAFVRKYTWTFTIDLGISAIMDIVITVSLCYLLRRKQKEHPSSMDHILDSLILYTFKTGILTCIATLVVLICWLAIPTNLVFMSLYFVIIKLYSNSLLATLNTRKNLQQANAANDEQATARTQQNSASELTLFSRIGSVRKHSLETRV